jgi:hypothetical protein
MKKTLLVLMAMGGAAFAQDPYATGPGGPGAPQGNYSQGNYPAAGAYAPPQGAYAAPPVCAPGTVWVNGYCAVPPYAGAYWIGPGFYGGRFVAGYWGHGGIGYAPGFAYRGGYRGNYAVRGGYAVRGSAMRGGGGHGGRR